MRRLIVFAILLSGCSGAAKPSKKVEAKSTFVSKWHPPAEPDPKSKTPPPPAPVKVEPLSPDPVAEKRLAEALRKKEEDQRKRAKDKEFARMPSAERRRLALAGDALTTKGLEHLTDDELAVISHFPLQFPAVNPDSLTQALAACGDGKGAREHLTSLRLTDPATVLKVRAAFALTPKATCETARAAAEEVGRVGLTGSSDSTKAFVARHPELFPIPPATPPAPGRDSNPTADGKAKAP